jgi:hypothetical protein
VALKQLPSALGLALLLQTSERRHNLTIINPLLAIREAVVALVNYLLRNAIRRCAFFDEALVGGV